MLKIDLINATDKKLLNGVKASDIDQIETKLENAKQKFMTEKSQLAFANLPHDFENLKKELAKVDEYSKNFNTIVVIGVGGSDLGARALHRALNHQYHNQTAAKKLYFTGDTTDPESISDLVDVLDLSQTLFIVISKSGNTIEQSSAFVFFRNLVITNLGVGEELNHFVLLTDAETGTLRKIANEKGYKTLTHGPVGGRFSVLSTVGMIPAHLIGLDVSQFLKGAQDLDLQLSSSDISNDLVMQYVATQYIYYKQGKNISVMMPYVYALADFAKWYQQLWAESLGKKLDNDGKVVFEGFTPTAALGPVDQHSQLQLYNEGPNDKFITLLVSENSRKDLRLPENFYGIEVFEFMKGRSFHDILKFALETTAFSLTRNDRPNVTITIPQIDEYHLGQLFYFFEVATAYMGYLLNINPFDQPGVELSKNAMYGVLGKEGYEEVKKEFEDYKTL